MSDRERSLEQEVRSAGTLKDRLEESRRRIGLMCAQGRGPRMSIPVRAVDDDVFICLALDDAIAALSAPPEPEMQPAAWIRGHQWQTNGVTEYDEEVVPAGHGKPKGDGWVPLFPCATRQTTGPLKLDSDRQVFFYEQDHYYLSNFSAFQVRLVVRDHDFGGERCIDFDTSEIAYHWFKFEGDGREYEGDHHVRGLILSARSSHEAFKIAEKWRDHRRPDWDAVKVGIMRDILWAKVGQHEYVYRKLTETGDRELIENSWRDDFWGWGLNRDGQNMLGKLWMEIRANLRAETKGEADAD